MSKESVMFLMSMSNTMSLLWPPPIEMEPMDDGTIITDNQKSTNIIASRWAVCAEIIRLMLSRMGGCGVEIAIGKSTDLGVSMTRGNSDEKLPTLLNLLESISKTTVANHEANAEYAIREIEKMAKNEAECKKKRVHWFVDAEMFVNLNHALVERKFASNFVTLYPIGEISTFYNSFESAKHVTTRLVRNGVDIRFLVCRSDLNELKNDILSEKRYEMVENVAMCKFGKEAFDIKLIQTRRVGKVGWSVKSLIFYGFLPEIDLCRIGFSSQESTPESHVPITTESENGSRILYSIGEYMLSEHKKPRVALFRYYGDEKAHGFCIIVASEEIPEKGEIMLLLIRLNRAMSKELKVSLDFVDQIGETSEPLPDFTTKPVAPEDMSMIKRRFTEIGKLATSEAKRQKLDDFVEEYKFLEARDTFTEATAVWQKNALRQTTNDGNNNNNEKR